MQKKVYSAGQVKSKTCERSPLMNVAVDEEQIKNKNSSLGGQEMRVNASFSGEALHEDKNSDLMQNRQH